MECLTRYDLCNLAAKIIGEEFNTPDFTSNKTLSKDYERSVYLYTWFCFNEINAPQRLIRHTLWQKHKYPKTVYQVIRRMYERRKDNEIRSDIQYIKNRFNKELANYTVRGIEPVREGKQMRLFAA